MYPDRQSTRLPNYDYAHPGMYFITICTHEREPILSAIDSGYTILTPIGQFVEQTLLALPSRFPNLKTDKFILMPNHIHAILFLESRQSSQKPDGASPAPTKRTSLSDVVCAFKSLSTIGVNKMRISPSNLLWQRNYYEHIIRTTMSRLDHQREIWRQSAW